MSCQHGPWRATLASGLRWETSEGIQFTLYVKEIPPMFAHTSFPRRAALVICAAIGASACSDAATSGARHPLTVSITTQGQGVAADRALADITIAAGTSSLVITKAQIVARRIELASAAATACANTIEAGDDDAESNDGCAEVEVGPMLLDIPLDASTKTNITASVPAGSYRALELRVSPATSGNQRSMQFIASHPEIKNASVRIEGSYNGKPFVFLSAIDARIETTFSSPVTVDATNPNVTIAIDLSNWFSDGSGGALDPSNSANAARISANIAGSFHAFEDDDHDGHEDHHR